MTHPAASRHPEPSRLEIDLGRLDANFHQLRRLLQDPSASKGSQANLNFRPDLCAVVKADAYGLGARPIARRLARSGVDMLAVYSPNQARELVEAGVDRPLLIMMPVHQLHRSDILYRTLLDGSLHLMVHDLEQLRAVATIGRRFGCAVPVHLFLDTGLCREGMDENQLLQAVTLLPTLRTLRLAGVCSHFADARADTNFCDEQFERFQHGLTRCGIKLDPNASPHDPLLHIANTYACLSSRKFHLSMVRVGLGLFGYGEHALGNRRIVPDRRLLQPIVRWVSHLVHVTHHPAGQTVGYGRTHTLTRDSILGVVPVGYGDGYPQALSNKARVQLLDNSRAPLGEAPVIGKVNMDQLVIDLTDAPSTATIHEVELLSAEYDSPCNLERLAAQAGMNCYEMLTRLCTRLPRRYIQSTAGQPPDEPPF